MEDLPLGRTAALVPEFAVKDLPLGRTHDDDILYNVNDITARGTAPPSGNSTCHISAGQCPATFGKDCASLLPKTTGITASLACTFARHVAHRTCLGYGWSATYSPTHTFDALWTRIQTAWRDIPQEDIQGLFDSMPRRIETLIAAHGGFTPH